jgi:hypothetical protein
MYLVRQDMIFKFIMKHHDGVVGKGPANQGRHGTLPFNIIRLIVKEFANIKKGPQAL